MLSYTTGFTGNNICTSYIVKKRSLAMVNVTHNCYNWRTVNKCILFINIFFDKLYFFFIKEINFKIIIISNECDI